MPTATPPCDVSDQGIDYCSFRISPTGSWQAWQFEGSDQEVLDADCSFMVSSLFHDDAEAALLRAPYEKREKLLSDVSHASGRREKLLSDVSHASERREKLLSDASLSDSDAVNEASLSAEMMQ